MRSQPRLIATLIGIMCLIRFGLGAAGYAEPIWLMGELGAPLADNQQMPYVVRVWAIRDMVLAVLVAAATPLYIVPLLFGCIVIDTFDVLSALLSYLDGLYNAHDAIALTSTALLALVPESIALALILKRRRHRLADSE